MTTTTSLPIAERIGFEIVATGSGMKLCAYTTAHKLEDVLRAGYFMPFVKTFEVGDRVEVVAEADTDAPQFVSLYVAAIQTPAGEIRKPLRFIGADVLRMAGYRGGTGQPTGIVLKVIRSADAEAQEPPRKHDLTARPGDAAA